MSEDIQDFTDLLRKHAEMRAKSKSDMLAFSVRCPAFTFPDVEVFWGNRVAALKLSRIKYNRENGNLDEFARHTIASLSGRSMFPRATDIYRVQDLMREKYFALLDLVRQGPPGAIKSIQSKLTHAVRHAAGDEKLTDVAEYTVRVKKLEEEIVALFPKKRGPKPKTKEEPKDD